jgi:O-antigen/teichoic acid export membrane protein
MQLRTLWARQTEDGSALLRGLAAYGSAELVVRITRILTVIVIARRLSPEMMGAAALALSLFELVRVLANAGIGQRIIAAPDALLASTCNSAHRLFWILCPIISALQLALAAALAASQPAAAAMLALLSLVYLTMPAGLVQVFLLMREGRLTTTARIGATQTLADHLLTLVLVLAWPDPATIAFAIVLPKLLTTPIWLAGVRQARPWARDPAAGFVPLAGFVRFGAGVLVTEIAGAARAQIDKLIIGAMLGVKALGIWYFAFNAGLGITTSFVGAFGTVLFPWLCKAADRNARALRYRHGILIGLAVFLPMTLAQVLLAPIYVPLLFGSQWTDAAPLVALLGLAALPMVAAAATTAWLRADGATNLDAAISTSATIAALAGLTLAAPHGLAAAATAYVAGLALVLVPATIAVFARSAAGNLLSSKESFA